MTYILSTVTVIHFTVKLIIGCKSRLSDCEKSFFLPIACCVWAYAKFPLQDFSPDLPPPDSFWRLVHAATNDAGTSYCQ